MGEEEYRRLATRLGAALRRRRQNLGLTQEEIANDLGMVTRRYQTIEAGEQNLTLKTLSRLAKTLRIAVKDLF